jgi:excisionase family DNA binding protein
MQEKKTPSITVKEAARRTSHNRNTTRKLAYLGEIAHLLFGSAIRIPVTGLEEWILRGVERGA